MEAKKEKKMIQEAYPLQQKVFKFHNVSKDVILGNKRVKKEVKGKSKKLPPDKLQHQIEESQEKMAEMILKQYIPIRQKVAPVVNSQTKKYKEAISLRKTKNSFGSKPFQQDGDKNKNLEELVNQQPQISSTNLEKPPGIRLVDISLLKEPKSCSNLSLCNNFQETVSRSHECKSPEPSDIISEDIWTSNPMSPGHIEEAPLDLSKKKLPDQFSEEILPLDLSRKNNNINESNQYKNTGEPPPLMLINEPLCSLSSPPLIPTTMGNLYLDDINEFPIRANRNKMMTLHCSNEPQNTNQQVIKIPQLLQLQPIQVVFKPNPVMELSKSSIAGQTEVFASEARKPVTTVSSSESTRQKIKTKLSKKSMNMQNCDSQGTTTSSGTAIQPIQMVFTDGKFVQVLPSQGIQKLRVENEKKPVPDIGSCNVKEPRKRRRPDERIKTSLTKLQEPLEIESTPHRDGEPLIDSYEYVAGPTNNNIFNKNQPNFERRDIVSKTPESMVKTNEMVTSNGGVFCTFKNVNRMRNLRTSAKTRRRRVKPDQSSGINTEQKMKITSE